MKLGTTDHPKMLLLAHRLGIDQAFAVGIIHGLHDFTAAYARRGNVGKWNDEQIALGCRTTLQASVLIPALLECGWLDRHPLHRLVVHDWHEHAEDYVKTYLARNNLTFANQEPLDPAGPLDPDKGEEPAAAVPDVETLPDEACRNKLEHVPTSVCLPMPLPRPEESPLAPQGGVGVVDQADELVVGFWKALGVDRFPVKRELEHAGELLARWGPEKVKTALPLVVAGLKREKREVRWFGGVVRDFERELAKLGNKEDGARRRAKDAAGRRRAAFIGEQARQQNLQAADIARERWEGLKNEERARIRREVTAKWPFLAGTERGLEDACLIEISLGPHVAAPARSKPPGRGLGVDSELTSAASR